MVRTERWKTCPWKKPEGSLRRLRACPKRCLFPREDTALGESFYPSDEVTLSAFAVEGRVVPLTLTDRQLLDDPEHIGVCVSHRYPSIHADRTAEIEAMADTIAGALGITQGPVYVQFLVGKGGVIVNEAAARIGGAV